MLNFIDREVIQKLLTVVRGLEKEEKSESVKLAVSVALTTKTKDIFAG